MDDANFELVMEYSDSVARSVYREEAKAIEELRKGIIEVSGKEEPYDIFICYKETDENGERTIDSVLAQDVYDALCEKGYRVFFSRITLEDKLGQEYEPYIFAALNSAKVMLAFGTSYDYYNAVWVKNEWSRYLQLMTQDKSKHLIPCYKDIDAYDMPKEFAKLQAQDMGKVGAVQDLLRGIEKLIGVKNEEPKETIVREVVNTGGTNVDSLIKRGYMALEDSEWDKAIEFFEQALNIDAECAEGYLGKALAIFKISSIEQLKNCKDIAMLKNKDFEKAIQFANPDLKNTLIECKNIIQTNSHSQYDQLKQARKRNSAVQNMIAAYDDSSFSGVIRLNLDGTVTVMGDSKAECNVPDWSDIVGITISNKVIIGLKSDGMLVKATQYDCFNISEWKNIVAVSTVGFDIIGLTSDGNVVGDGARYWNKDSNISSWKDIVAISMGGPYQRWDIGLKMDGTVVADGYGHQYAQCNVSNWTDIVAISVSDMHTVGLKSDGTVVAVGKNDYGQCDVQDWKDIVAISTASGITVGLKLDGTVVVAGSDYNGKNNVSDWTDIVAIFAAQSFTVGIKSDGTVVVASKSIGYDKSIINEISKWKLFDNIDTIEEERRIAREALQRKQEEERIRAEQERQKQEEARRKAEEEKQRLLEKQRQDEIERQKKEAELKKQKLEKLESELSILKSKRAKMGIFAISQKKDIDANIEFLQNEINKLR